MAPLHREVWGAFATGFRRRLAFCAAGRQRALARATELRAEKPQKVYNGALEITSCSSPAPSRRRAAIEGPPRFRSAGAEMVYNRIQKNHQRLKRWLEREKKIRAYRIYDADLPEYAAAVDVYEDRLHIPEYQAPSEIPQGQDRGTLQGFGVCGAARL
ncbi:MAG: hypothetical protein U1F26_11440 [Lysobacterales bacterium]